MRFPIYALPLLVLTTSGHAQCFLQNRSCDANAMEIRSQFNVTVPLADKTSSGNAFKAVEDAQRQLSSLQDREMEALEIDLRRRRDAEVVFRQQQHAK